MVRVCTVGGCVIGALSSCVRGESAGDATPSPVAATSDAASPPTESSTALPPVAAKRIVGATAIVAEAESELTFRARIDTGASSCSLHVEKWVVENESAEMRDNIGKKIRFLIKSGEKAERWLERTIADLVIIRTSEDAERRYKVPMTLICEGVEKRVLVSLNDRSHMKFPLLVGRNFLDGDFLVDVSK